MSQIFKKNIEAGFFVNFIKKYANNKGNHQYVFNHISYKKANYNDDVQNLINYLLNYYHKSKQFYLTRNMNYKNFITIIRQICNFLCIPYTSKIIYSNSKYNINYKIYLDGFIEDSINNEVEENNIEHNETNSN